MTCDPTAKMKALCWLTLALGAMNLHSADILRELECHDKVVRHGIETFSLAGEINSLFEATNVDHFISNFGSKTDAPIWNSVTYFAGRYILVLQVPVAIDYQNCRFNGTTGSAAISVNEVTKVDISTSGNAQATLKGGIGELTESDWGNLVTHHGDWSVVKVPIRTNGPPIKDFDEYVRQAREPIRNRQEGFDKPIKQTLQALRDRKASLPDANEEKKAANKLPVDGASN